MGCLFYNKYNARVTSNVTESTWFQLHVKYNLFLKDKRNKIPFVQQVLVQTPYKPRFICSLAAVSEAKKNLTNKTGPLQCAVSSGLCARRRK
jgi:hypothetical protein